MSRMLSKMNLISVVQQLPKEDIETIQGYVEMIENENQKYKEVIDKIKHYIEKECRIYGLSMPIDVATHLDNILGILKEVK